MATPKTKVKRSWREIMEQVKLAKASSVRVGVIASKSRAPSKPGDINIVELAMIHEFGAPGAGIPERSFIRSTFNTHARAEFEEVLRKLAKGLLAGKIDAKRAMTILGTWGVKAIKNSISARLIKQDLAPATVKRKNRTAKDKSDATTALVDTGRLINAIAYELVMGGP